LGHEFRAAAFDEVAWHHRYRNGATAPTVKGVEYGRVAYWSTLASAQAAFFSQRFLAHSQGSPAPSDDLCNMFGRKGHVGSL
jgi:hypothetical protein